MHPRDAGLQSSNWTCKTVRQAVKQEFKVPYSLEGIRCVLQRLGFSFKLPEYRYLYSDPAERAFFEHQLQHAVQHLDDSWDILALDEATVRTHPTRTVSWCLKGVTNWIWTRGDHQKTGLFAAVSLLTGNVNYLTRPRLNSALFCQFLERLLYFNGTRKLLLLLDNATYHRSKRVKAFLKKHAGRLQVIYFPRYTPQLNPVEQLFRWLRKTVTHNYFFPTLSELLQAVQSFFNRVSTSPREVLRRCQLKSLETFFG